MLYPLSDTDSDHTGISVCMFKSWEYSVWEFPP